jgi:hypothetical protein
LKAQGTVDSPITFKGYESTPGYWTGLIFNTSSSPANAIDHAVISDGGGAAGGANVTVKGYTSHPS